MSDIAGGDSFADGQTVNAARLNNMTNNAVIQAAFISGKAGVTPVGADSLVIFQASSSALKKAAVSALLALSGGGTVTSIGLTHTAGIFSITGSPITGAGNIEIEFASKAANQVLASPDGASGAPTIRAIKARDIAVPTQFISAFNIDWSLANSHYKTPPAGTNTFTFSNQTDGQTIQVLLVADSTHTIIWPSGLHWKNNVSNPAITSGNWQLYEFRNVFGNIFAEYIGNFG